MDLMTIMNNVMKILMDQDQMIEHDQKYGGGSKIFQNQLLVQNRDGSETYVTIDTRYPGWREWSEDMYRKLGFSPPLRPGDV